MTHPFHDLADALEGIQLIGGRMSDDLATSISAALRSVPSGEGDGWEWMFVEIMGHRSHWGRTREIECFGTKMLRVDVPIKGDPAAHGWKTHFYGGTAIFSITLTDEETVMKKNMPRSKSVV